jgi:hypothetical protein
MQNKIIILLTNLSALKSSIPWFLKLFLVNELTGAQQTPQKTSKHNKITKIFILKKAHKKIFIYFISATNHKAYSIESE